MTLVGEWALGVVRWSGFVLFVVFTWLCFLVTPVTFGLSIGPGVWAVMCASWLMGHDLAESSGLARVLGGGCALGALVACWWFFWQFFGWFA